jgi:hypothetical protein
VAIYSLEVLVLPLRLFSGLLLIGSPLFALAQTQSPSQQSQSQSRSQSQSPSQHQSKPQTQTLWTKEARQHANTASKIAIEPPEHSPKAGHDVDLVLHLRNDKDEAISAPADTEVQVQMITESGRVALSKTCVIPKKSAHIRCHLGDAPSSGVFKLRAIPGNRELLDATQYLLVRPNDKDKETRKKAAFAPPSDGAFGARIMRVAYNAPETEFEPPAPPQHVSDHCEDPISQGPSRVTVKLIGEPEELVDL